MFPLNHHHKTEKNLQISAIIGPINKIREDKHKIIIALKKYLKMYENSLKKISFLDISEKKIDKNLKKFTMKKNLYRRS